MAFYADYDNLWALDIIYSDSDKSTPMIHFPRNKLADELVALLRGQLTFSDAPNGLFLAAPRRTGKSTFLQVDLKPALESAGVVVVYVDLWADRRRDPASLIADAIGNALASPVERVARDQPGLAGRLLRKTLRNPPIRVDSVSIPGIMKVDLKKIGQPDGITLPEALARLHEKAGAPVALIIDEAQHALTSEDGEVMMAALKSARDQLNRPGEVNLMLIMSGSDRDKLLRLVHTNGAPFFGSQISSMPLLGRDFIEHIVDLIERQRPGMTPVDADELQKAFEIFGRRPQFFMEALGQALSPLAGSDDVRFETRVMETAMLHQQADEQQMESDFLGLRPLEQAVLWRMLEQGPRFRPYDADALRFYADKVKRKVTPQRAQAALESLRDRNPALIWKSARAEYAVDDIAMHRWYRQRVDAGTWPPEDPQGRLMTDDGDENDDEKDVADGQADGEMR